jgi:hypothetical protein
MHIGGRKIKESPPQDKSDEIPTTAPVSNHLLVGSANPAGNRRRLYFSLAWTDFVANQSKANNI